MKRHIAMICGFHNIVLCPAAEIAANRSAIEKCVEEKASAEWPMIDQTTKNAGEDRTRFKRAVDATTISTMRVPDAVKRCGSSPGK